MARPGVTIAIPNWNHEVFLPRSVGSGLAAVKELRRHGLAGEVLVVDDQSRDGSPVLLRQLEALYYGDGLRVLIQAENGGVCRARNEALRRARHRHVLVMDADNEVIPENVVLFHRALNDTGAAIAYGNLIAHEWHKPSLRLGSNETFQPKIFHANYLDTFSMLDRDQVLTRTRGYSQDARVQSLGDWEFLLSIAANGGKIVFVPVVLGNYYYLPGSMLQEGAGRDARQTDLIRRTYDQAGVRRSLPANACHLRYHPDIGYC